MFNPYCRETKGCFNPTVRGSERGGGGWGWVGGGGVSVGGGGRRGRGCVEGVDRAVIL